YLGAEPHAAAPASLVSGEVTVSLVPVLEIHDVEAGPRARRLAALRTRDFLFKAVVEVAVVMDAGERVGVRGALQALVKPGDLDLRRDLRTDRLHEREVALAEGGHGGMRQDEHAHRLPARDERDHEPAADTGVAP